MTGPLPTMLAITGGKGGCGKTTTALGLARELADAGADPLVVDADTDLPDVHRLADVDREPTWDCVPRGEPIERTTQRSASLGGVAVLPAGSSDLLAAALERVGDWHGPVLVDCPAGAGPTATLPLRRADRSILATTAEPASLSDAAKTARVATRLDAPPVAALVRETRDVPALPFDCPRVEGVPAIDVVGGGGAAVRTVLDDPRVRSAYRSVSRLGDAGTRYSGEWERTERVPDRNPQPAERIFASDNGDGIFNGR